MISRNNNDIALSCSSLSSPAICGCPVFWLQFMYDFSNFQAFCLHNDIYLHCTLLMISRNNNNIMNLCCVAVCHLLRSGVAALFGPQSGTTSSHVQSICDAMEIPHIETRWDYRLRRDEYSVNLYPHPSALSKVSPSLQIDSFFCFLNSKR